MAIYHNIAIHNVCQKEVCKLRSVDTLMQDVSIINWGKFNCTLLADIFFSCWDRVHYYRLCIILVAKLQLPSAECLSCLHTTVASELVHEMSEIVLQVPE